MRTTNRCNALGIGDLGFLHAAKAELDGPAVQGRELGDQAPQLGAALDGASAVNGPGFDSRRFASRLVESGRAHPLPHGDLREHLVDEMRGDIGHAPAEARWAKPSTLAGKRHDQRLSTLPASKVGETVLEHAAAQVRLELLDDEVRQAAGLLGSLEEGRPVLLDELVQPRLVGPATLVAVSTRSRRAR
jgi:hypothetical protein